MDLEQSRHAQTSLCKKRCYDTDNIKLKQLTIRIEPVNVSSDDNRAVYAKQIQLAKVCQEQTLRRWELI